MRWEDMPPHDRAAAWFLLWACGLLLLYLMADVVAVVQYVMGW